ncbi:MAG: alpha/beta hydrolase [Caldilineaceae bacterium]
MKTAKQTLKSVRFGPLTKITVSLAGLVGIFLSASIFYQQSAMARDRTTYVPSNHLVEVDGVKMHIRCAGEGTPTIIFESGAGTSYLNWWAVQQAIVQDVRTCLYDRQGLGWSEYTGTIPTSKSVAQTLHTLLENAGESGPYVLVGHSLGGLYVREYAARYPNDIVGIVLIDAVHQQQYARFPEEFSALSTSEPLTLRLCRLLAPTGILRILNLGPQITAYPEETPLYHEDIAIFYQSHSCAGVSLELASAFMLDTSTAPDSLGDIPLAVLTAGVPVAERSDFDSAAFAPETLQAVERVRLELQEELAALSTNSSWTIVEDATHFIHHDQPQVVIAAIRDILLQATFNESPLEQRQNYSQ